MNWPFRFSSESAMRPYISSFRLNFSNPVATITKAALNLAFRSILQMYLGSIPTQFPPLFSLKLCFRRNQPRPLLPDKHFGTLLPSLCSCILFEQCTSVLQNYKSIVHEIALIITMYGFDSLPRNWSMSDPRPYGGELISATPAGFIGISGVFSGS
jgi:hypothetical protein